MKRVILPEPDNGQVVLLDKVSDHAVLLVKGKNQDNIIGVIRYSSDDNRWHVAIGQQEVYKTGYSNLSNLLLNLSQTGYEVFVQ